LQLDWGSRVGLLPGPLRVLGRCLVLDLLVLLLLPRLQRGALGSDLYLWAQRLGGPKTGEGRRRFCSGSPAEEPGAAMRESERDTETDRESLLTLVADIFFGHVAGT